MTTPIVIPPADSDNLKQCRTCGELKPRDQFYSVVGNRDRLSTSCKICMNLENKRYREANSERLKAQKKERRAEKAKSRPPRVVQSAEEKSEYNRQYRERNADRIAEYKRAYLQTPAGKAAKRANRHRRRLRKYGYDGAFTPADLEAIRVAQTDNKGRLICWACGKPITGIAHLDHWIPLAKGGTNDAGNLHYMHAKCNRSKASKMPTEIGRLL